MKIIPLVAIASIAFLFSCSKKGSDNPNTPNSNTVKIQLIKGGGSLTDTIGYAVKDTVLVKVTVGGKPAAGYGVQFLPQNSCDKDIIYSLPTQADGTAGITWRLAGNAGQQSLRCVVLDAQNHRLDSVTVTTNAIATNTVAWHPSACLVFGYEAEEFCKLSTGRLFTAFGALAMRYSDDNGISWFPVKTPDAKPDFYGVASNGQDVVMGVSNGEGFFVSTDKGTTWTQVTSPTTNYYISDFAGLPDGKFFYAAQAAQPFLSADNGKTWTLLTGLPSGAYTSITEDKNGILYVINIENNSLYKSIDGGKTWQVIAGPNAPIQQQQAIQVTSIMIDSKGWMYEGRGGSAGSGAVYVSKDGGATFATVIPETKGNPINLSEDASGNIYFTLNFNSLYMVSATSGSLKEIFDYSDLLNAYAVANNGNIVVNYQGISYHFKEQ